MINGFSKALKIYNCCEVQSLAFKSRPGSFLERVQRLKHWSDLFMLTLALEKTKPCKTSNFKRHMKVCTPLNMGVHVLLTDYLFQCTLHCGRPGNFYKQDTYLLLSSFFLTPSRPLIVIRFSIFLPFLPLFLQTF